MDPEIPDFISIADVVISTAGRDQGMYFYVIKEEQQYLFLVHGKDRQLDKPKRKKVKTHKPLREEFFKWIEESE